MLLCPHAGEQQHQGEGGTRGGCGNTLKALLLQPPEGTLAATACSAEPCSSQSPCSKSRELLKLLRSLVSLHTQHQEFFQAEQQGTHVQVLFLLHA